MWEYTHYDELCHYGIKGMQWGKRRYRNADGTLTPAGKKRYAEPHEDYKKAHSGKSYKSMSNQELKDTNYRLNMEKQYKDLTRKKSKGKQALNSFIKGAGVLTATVAAYKTYEKYGTAALDKLGDFVLRDLKGF